MTYELLKHPLWDVQICCLFAGLLMSLPKDISEIAPEMAEVRKLAASNFRRIYRTLSISEREAVREEIREYKKNPDEAITMQIERLRELRGNDDFLQQIKESDL